jgi:phosphonate transport system permease protein
MSQGASIRRWKRPPFIQNPTLRWGLWVGAAIYLSVAFGTMEINWDRVAEGVVRGGVSWPHSFPRIS